jgi:hypothetical protein
MARQGACPSRGGAHTCLAARSPTMATPFQVWDASLPTPDGKDTYLQVMLCPMGGQTVYLPFNQVCMGSIDGWCH